MLHLLPKTGITCCSLLHQQTGMVYYCLFIVCVVFIATLQYTRAMFSNRQKRKKSHLQSPKIGTNIPNIVEYKKQFFAIGKNKNSQQ
jgi:hypothetical protein